MDNETNKHGLIKPAFQYGLILSLSLIFLSLIFYLTGGASSKWGTYLTYPIILGVLFLGMKNFRDEFNDGFISYGRLLGYGTMVGVFAGVIYAVYAYIFYKFIGPEVIEEIHMKIEEEILTKNPNLTLAELEMAMKIAKSFSSPLILSIGSVFSYAFFSFVFSLIVAIFLKRKPKEEI